MVFADLVRDTLQTMRQHRLRTFLTMFGIAWGLICLIIMTAMGEGCQPRNT